VASWVEGAGALAIPVSPRFTLVDTLASPVEVREWQLQGLPTDALSTDNAILATRGSRWPLLIDPQRQALRWVRVLTAPNQRTRLHAPHWRAPACVQVACENG
jgi:dynein heavy chain, axonemal